MYDYFTGTVAAVTPTHIVLETAGIGYKINTANPYHFQEGTATKIFVEQIVRDTELSLYGFQTATDKALFNKLLNVSGIGPKSALAVLAAADGDSLVAAIENNDAAYLTQFPGIGKKTAQQIVLDLKGKLGEFTSTADLFAPQTTVPASVDNQALDDALAALAALGYTNKEVQRIGKQLAKMDLTTDAYLREGLRLLVK